MTPHVPRLTASPARSSRQRRSRAAAAWTVALVAGAGACLLAAGCSSSGTALNGTSMAGSSAGKMAAPAPAALPGRVPAVGRAPALHSGAPGRAGLTALPLPGGQSVIFTATLNVRAPDVQATVARATQLAQAAGGYVSGENGSMTQSGRTRPMVSIQFKVPAAV